MVQNWLSTRMFWVVAAAVSAAALGLAVIALVGTTGQAGTRDRTAEMPASGGSWPAPSATNRPEPTTLRRPDMQTPRPMALGVPARGLSFPVQPVGVTRTGAMALPDDPAVLGWYRFGAIPGEPGSTVLAGHLDSVRFGVGPLVQLDDVRPGDRLRVRTAAGDVDRYVVTGVDRYDRQRLPPALFARSGTSRLRVITCAGEYDADAGGYQLNLVVTATPR